MQTHINVAEQMKVIRSRLSVINWSMLAQAEPIARLANVEDEYTGRFWEGLFKAQRITDEAGFFARALSVDLNPVRTHKVPPTIY